MDKTTFKLATWNVNSIRIRLDLLKKLAETEQPDIICLQEVKAKKEDFPFAEIEALGYPHIALYSMPGYNGVAILSRTNLSAVEQKDWVGKHDARHIAARVLDDLEINNIYIPAGGDIPDPIANLSFAHKLTFMDDIAEYWELHKDDYGRRKMIVCGDFNVAPLENDVWSHKQMLKIVFPYHIQKIPVLYPVSKEAQLYRFVQCGVAIPSPQCNIVAVGQGMVHQCLQTVFFCGEIPVEALPGDIQLAA